MTPQQKYFARIAFKLKVHEANGFGFEQLFAHVMQYSQHSFVKIKPYGNQGDRGNDGYVKQLGRYYQMFAPEEAANKSQAAIAKAEQDFSTKLLPHWGTFCEVKEYVFVFNDKYHGSTYPLEASLAAIKSTHHLQDARVFLAKDLEDAFMALTEDQIMMIVGGIPSMDTIGGLDFSVLAEVIQHILAIPIDNPRLGKLVVPDIDEKIQFNGLQEFGLWLKAKQNETYQIDDYLVRNSDFAKAALRDHLASCYADSLLRFPLQMGGEEDQFGDLRFAAIVATIAPTTNIPVHDRALRDVALIIMAKYFETCDIFEEPSHAAS